MPLTSKVSVDLVSLVSFSYGEGITYFNGSTAKKMKWGIIECNP